MARALLVRGPRQCCPKGESMARRKSLHGWFGAAALVAALAVGGCGQGPLHSSAAQNGDQQQQQQGQATQQTPEKGGEVCPAGWTERGDGMDVVCAPGTQME